MKRGVIALIIIAVTTIMIISSTMHPPKLQAVAQPKPKPRPTHYTDLSYYLKHGYRITKKLSNNTYVLERVDEAITSFKPTNKTVSEIRLSDVAWAELSKPIRTYELIKEITVHEIQFRLIKGTKGIELSGYYGTKDIPLNKTCLPTLPNKITIKINLSKYLEIWKKENPELTTIVGTAHIKLFKREIALPWKDAATWTHIVLEVPIITDNYDNDTYLRYVIVPLFKKVIMRMCGVGGFVGRNEVAYAIQYFVLGLPYNEGSVSWYSWEYIIAYGGVCMHLSRLAVAIATYLGWKAVAAVGELHEVALLCEPWWGSGLKYVIKLGNETLSCHTWVNTGPEISRIDYLEIYEPHSYFKEEKPLSYKIG